MPKKNVNGIEIYYELHSQGDPLVLIMGLRRNIEWWYRQLPALRAHFQVLVFDNRGAGRTDKPAKNSIKRPSLFSNPSNKNPSLTGARKGEGGSKILNAILPGRSHLQIIPLFGYHVPPDLAHFFFSLLEPS